MGSKTVCEAPSWAALRAVIPSVWHSAELPTASRCHRLGLSPVAARCGLAVIYLLVVICVASSEHGQFGLIYIRWAAQAPDRPRCSAADIRRAADSSWRRPPRDAHRSHPALTYPRARLVCLRWKDVAGHLVGLVLEQSFTWPQWVGWVCNRHEWRIDRSAVRPPGAAVHEINGPVRESCRVRRLPSEILAVLYMAGYSARTSVFCIVSGAVSGVVQWARTLTAQRSKSCLPSPLSSSAHLLFSTHCPALQYACDASTSALPSVLPSDPAPFHHSAAAFAVTSPRRLDSFTLFNAMQYCWKL